MAPDDDARVARRDVMAATGPSIAAGVAAAAAGRARYRPASQPSQHSFSRQGNLSGAGQSPDFRIEL